MTTRNPFLTHLLLLPLLSLLLPSIHALHLGTQRTSPPSPRRLKDCADAQPGCTCIEVTMSQPNWTVLDMAVRGPRSGSAASDASLPLPAGAPGHPPAAPPAHISFNLSNLAAGYETPCTAVGGARDGVVACADAAPSDRPGEATFRFNGATGTLEINQTWTCNGGGIRATFTARGSAAVPLQCNDTSGAAEEDWDGERVSSERSDECDDLRFTVPWMEFEGIA